ncbi:MAG: hypothetical protein WDN06_11845 [Asticcacaulis sp.]
MQVYDADGHKVGGETQVNTTLAGSEYYQTCTALPDGGYIVAWEARNLDTGTDSIFSQRYNFAGAKIGAEIHVADNGFSYGLMYPSTTALVQTTGSPAAYVVTWASVGLDAGIDYGVFMQLYNLAGERSAVPSWSTAPRRATRITPAHHGAQ